MKKLPPEPRIPATGGFVMRVNELFKEAALIVNQLVDRVVTPTGVVSVAVGASPYAYSVPRDGSLVVAGGSGVSLSYIRQGVTTVLGSVPIVPVKEGDTVRITYTTAPTVTLI